MGRMSIKKELYHVFVEGTPKAQPRPRKGKHGNFYNPDNGVLDWKQTIQIAFIQKRQPITDKPVKIIIKFYFKKDGIRKNREYLHTSKPDIDNLQKAVYDSLSKLVWKDDCQIYHSEVSKYWSADKEGAEIWIEVTE